MWRMLASLMSTAAGMVRVLQSAGGNFNDNSTLTVPRARRPLDFWLLFLIRCNARAILALDFSDSSA
jgi:hypothetical protein